MKCEEFVSSLETGSAVGRLRARLHAKRCPHCAAKQYRLSELREALGAPAELTPYHRRVWQRVAVETAPAPARPWLTGPRFAVVGSLALAAAVVVAVVLSVGDNRAPHDGRIANRAVPPTKIDTQVLTASSTDLAELEVGLQRMEASLNLLAEEADRLEARRAISELAVLYPPLTAGDSS